MMEDKDIKEYHKMVKKLEKKETYKPLPDGLIIKKSSIEGQGLFTTKFIEKDVKLGLCHILIDEEVIRTPLGGFINHSDEPNCIKIESPEESVITYYSLVTSRDIEKDEELTVTYTLYNV